MDAFEKTVRTKTRQERQSIKFSRAQKETLCASMVGELQAKRLSAGRRLLHRIRRFWHSTYEVSLVPAVAAVCILIAAAGVKWLPPAAPQPAEPTYFIRLTDAGLEIIPLEHGREVEKSG